MSLLRTTSWAWWLVLPHLAVNFVFQREVEQGGGGTAQFHNGRGDPQEHIPVTFPPQGRSEGTFIFFYFSFTPPRPPGSETVRQGMSRSEVHPSLLSL